jgi:hypothetical protein
MYQDYEYRASQALKGSEFRFIKIIYSIILLVAMAFGVQKIVAGEYVLGNLLLIATLINTLSPLTYFNFLQHKSPLDFYFLIQDGLIKYKLNIFSLSKSIPLDQVERISYADQLISIKFKNGKSQYIEANKIFGQEKQAELKSWIKKFSRKR